MGRRWLHGRQRNVLSQSLFQSVTLSRTQTGRNVFAYQPPYVNRAPGIVRCRQSGCETDPIFRR
ncbi:hypothetical protein BGLA2_550024 [Burkholderia gladioli]|nr:hypothetical protein BGLA2_550024 [Burkholderia gladioli]